MYLVDTNVISELRKGKKADPGVRAFLRVHEKDLFLPVQAVGELSFGVESLKRKGDILQAERVQVWLDSVLDAFQERVLIFDQACALLWGKLRSGNDQNQIDKQIAAIALVYDLTVVTRNTAHYAETSVRIMNPFLADAPPAQPPQHSL